jgi:hypothetical protein
MVNMTIEILGIAGIVGRRYWEEMKYEGLWNDLRGSGY